MTQDEDQKTSSGLYIYPRDNGEPLGKAFQKNHSYSYSEKWTQKTGKEQTRQEAYSNDGDK